MTYTTLASDALILAAGAVTFTACAMATKNIPFRTSLGTEGDDDSLCAPEEQIEEPEQQQQKEEITQEGGEKKVMRLGDVEKKVVTLVTVEEVPLTPMGDEKVVDIRLE